MTYNRGSAAIILNTQGHVLLVKHTYGRQNWELPGGSAEPNETVIETAVREVREETGLHVVPVHTTGVYYEPDGDFVHFAFLCCTTEPSGVLAIRLQKEEIADCAFWPAESLPRPISDFTIRRIQDALSGVRLPLPTIIPPRTWFEAETNRAQDLE